MFLGLGTKRNAATMNRRIFIQLGRLGDVLNLLPLAWHASQQGERMCIMVAKEFADVLDGTSYCDKIVFDGEPWELDKAFEEAQKLSSDVCCVQTAGPTELVRKYTFQPKGMEHAVTDCFQKEAWKLCGKLGLWKEQLPLVFDKRNGTREVPWIPKDIIYGRKQKKKVLLVATSGETSPFPYRDLVAELLRLRFPNFNIIDLSLIKAERIYDLLALYEIAHCLVASDSAPLHLAYACEALPVAALINDTPSLWHGSAWRANHIFHCRYKDFPKRAVEMLEAIDKIEEKESWAVGKWTTPRVIHVYSRYEEIESNAERRKEALRTWGQDIFKEFISTPIEVGAMGRDSKNKLKDERRFPFVKDVIRLSMLRAEDDDLIVLTRVDTAFTPGVKFIEHDGPYFSHRTSGDSWHPAVDLFAFTKRWWIEHEPEYPQDMVLGFDPWWHRVLLELFKKHKAKELPFAVYRAAAKQVMGSNETQPYVVHNEKLAKEWLLRNGVNSLFPRVSHQIEAIHINRKALEPWGYNCSLIRWQNRFLLAYRHHGAKNVRTELAIAELDDKFNVTRTKPVELTGASFEDPRFFVWNETLYVCFVESTWPNRPLTSIVKYGEVVEGVNWIVKNIVQPDFGKNDGSIMEKNWVFFEKENRLWCIQMSHPEQIVYTDKIPQSTKGPHWQWGPIKGGTAPVPYEGQLLRFFHSTLDNEPAPDRRRYYIGAMLMEPTPPFEVKAVSREPIIRGSEEDDLEPLERAACLHFKAKVVFPAGCVEQDGGWLLSMGVNDSSCVIAKIKPENLQL